MDGEAVVHTIFVAEDDEDRNKSNEEDSTLHEEDSFTADRLATEQEGKITAHYMAIADEKDEEEEFEYYEGEQEELDEFLTDNDGKFITKHFQVISCFLY